MVRGRLRWVVIGLLFVVLAACGDSDEDDAAKSATGGNFACLDFLARVTSGPNAGKSWSGDLILKADDTGAFTGRLVPVGAANRETLEITDGARVICRAVGQRNGAQVSWFLYCANNERIFGTGQITVVGDSQELRGITQGPSDNDFGIYHGRNYPPYIRTISGD
jgi:hypothetical protein